MIPRRIGRFVVRYLWAVVACLYLPTFGLLSAKYRRRLYKLISQFGYQPVKTLIPKVSLSEILQTGTALSIHEPLGAGGNVSLTELAVIASLIQRRRPERLLEIGTLDGRTTLNMAANAPASAQVYTLDLPGQPSGACFRDHALSAMIVQLYGDSAKFDFLPFYNTMDFIFIDADHTDAYVLSDSRQAMKLIRNGQGTIIWHDYDTWDWEGTTRALNQLYTEGGLYARLRHIEETSLVYLALD